MKATKQPNRRFVFWGLAIVPFLMAIDALLKHAWLDVATDLMLSFMFSLHARGKT